MLTSLGLAAVLGTSAVLAAPTAHPDSQVPRSLLDVRSSDVVTLPLRKRASPRKSQLARRWNDKGNGGGNVTQQGLGDLYDQEYLLDITVGNQTLPVLLDTGSSDLILWTANCNSVSCTTGAQAGIPRYDPTQDPSFYSSGVGQNRSYGTSSSATYATGEIGFATVDIAGFTGNNASLEVVNDTSLPQATFSSGIIGAAFPVSSINIIDLFNNSLTSPNSTLDNSTYGGNSSLNSTSLKHQAQVYLDLFDTVGGLFSRFADNGQFKSPGFTLTLQRLRDPDTNTSNDGLVTFGGLPSGIKPKELTYAKVHRPKATSWLSSLEVSKALPDSATQWEAVIDGVSVGGKKLPASTSAPEIVKKYGNIAMFDSGSPGAFGPPDLVEQIYASIPGFDNSTGQVPCDAKLEISVCIGGKEFPINPIDWFIYGLPQQNTTACTLGLFPNDPATEGTENSWIFGDAFLKNALVYHHYGCLKNPDSDPPKLGFLSTTNKAATSARFDELEPQLRTANPVVPTESLIALPPSATTSVARGVASKL